MAAHIRGAGMLVTMSCFETGREQNRQCFGLSLGETYTVHHSRALPMNHQGLRLVSKPVKNLDSIGCPSAALSLSHKPALGRGSTPYLILAVSTG